MRISQLFRILIFTLSIFLLMNIALWSRGKEIVLENHNYYVIHPNGEKVSIVSSQAPGGPWIEVIFSPDSSYVAYTADNGTGWEGQGRNLYYCKTDGGERTLVLSTSAGIDALSWVKTDEKQYIVFVQLAGGAEDMGHPNVYDFEKHQIVFDTLGLGLVRIGNTPKFLVNDFLFSEKKAFVLDLSKVPFRISSLDSFPKTESDTSRLWCAYAVLQQTEPELRRAPVQFIPASWPQDPYNKSEYIDLVDTYPEFNRLSCLVPSPNGRFVAFSATGSRFTCNGILDTKTHKTHALRFFLGTFDGEPCWSPNSEYVAFINLVDSRNKFINVFSIDSVLNSKYPMIAKKEFERPTAKSLKICFSSNSDTLYYEVPGGFRDESGQFIIRR
jgi:hypothetical protein